MVGILEETEHILIVQTFDLQTGKPCVVGFSSEMKEEWKQLRDYFLSKEGFYIPKQPIKFNFSQDKKITGEKQV
jgi:hypothetical protein